MDANRYRNRVLVAGLLFLPALGWIWKSMEAPDVWVETVTAQARVHYVKPMEMSYPPKYQVTVQLPSGEGKYLTLPSPAPSVGANVPVQEMRYKNGKKRYVFNEKAWNASLPSPPAE